MITEFMTVTGYAFWGMSTIVFGLVALCLSRESEVMAVFLAIIAVIAAVLLTDIRPGPWALLLAPLYLAVGCAWALHKWRGLVLGDLKKARAEYVKYRESVIKTTPSRMNDDGVVVNPTILPFDTWSSINRNKPLASNNKDRITGWIGLWPWSMSWVVLQFPWRVVVWSWEQMTSAFDRMTDRIWSAS